VANECANGHLKQGNNAMPYYKSGVLYFRCRTCHNQGFKNRQRLAGVKAKGATEELELFEKHFERSVGCWIWAGGTNKNGYGQFNRKGPFGTVYAHRFSYEAYKAKIPDDMQLHHTCGVPNCINPEHLLLVSQAQHTQITWDKRRQII
jgi:hypothetical protein